MRERYTDLAEALAPFLVNIIGGGGGGSSSGGGGGGGGTSDHGALTGLEDDDHPFYLPSDGTRPMEGTLDMGGFAIVDVSLINGIDMEEFEQYYDDIAALRQRTVYGGDGLYSDEVQFKDGSPTLDVVVSDFAGAGLMDDGSNNLRLRPGDGLKLDGLFAAVDEDFAFAWTGHHTMAASVSSYPTFDDADPIIGAKIDFATGDGWFSNLRATNLTVKTFISDVTLALQGSQYITKSKAELSRDFVIPSTTGTLYVHALPGQPGAVFESGDYVRLRYVIRTAGLEVGDVWGTVTGYTNIDDDEQSWTFTRTAGTVGKTIYEGMVALDYGKSGDGYIELTSLGTNTPKISLRKWVTNPAISANHSTVAILGNLGGHTDADYGVLDEYGLFSDRAYLRGILSAGGGAVVIGEDGMNIARGNASVNDVNAIQWKADPFDGASETTGSIYGYQYEYDLRVHNTIQGVARWGGSTGADEGIIGLTADETVGGGAIAQFFITGKAAPEAKIWLKDGDLNNGVFTIDADIVIDGHYTPYSNGGSDIGSASKKIRNIYAQNLYVDTTVGVPATWHHHDSQYYPRAEIDAFLAGKAPAVHSHAGYVTSVALTAALTGYIDEDALALALADYYSALDLDTALANKADAIHSHALADLSERNYGSLTARSHVLATATALGTDHTVSGLTAGQVLRATGATTAKFMRLDFADLDNTSHDLDDHTGDLSWARVSKAGSSLADLETRAYTSLTGRQHSIVGGDHSITAARYSVVGTPGATNALGVWATSSDGSTGNVLLRTDSAGDLEVNDLTLVDLLASGNAIVTGDVRATKVLAGATDDIADAPLDVRGLALLDDVDAENISANTMNVNTIVFTKKATEVHGGRLRVAPKGAAVLRSELATTAGQSTLDIPVEDIIGVHETQFSIGDKLQLSGLFAPTIADGGALGAANSPQWARVFIPSIDPNKRLDGSLWMQVQYITDETTHFVYHCIPVDSGDVLAGTWPKGSAVIGYGNPSDAAPTSFIDIAANDRAYSPYIGAYSLGTDVYNPTKIAWFGELGKLGVGNLGERGIAAGQDLDNAMQPHFLISHQRQRIFGVDLELEDTYGPILSITKENGFRVYANQIDTTIDDNEYYNARHTGNYVQFVEKRGGVLGTIGISLGYIGDGETYSYQSQALVIEAPFFTAHNEEALIELSYDEEEETGAYLDPNVPSGSAIYIRTQNADFNESAQLSLFGPEGVASLEADLIYVVGGDKIRLIAPNEISILASTIVLSTLPTSADGLPSNALWNDGGTVKIVS